MKEFTPHKQEKEVISVRVNTDLLNIVDSAADHAGISRNEFINQCIAYALEHLSQREK